MKVIILYTILSLFLHMNLCVRGRGISNDVDIRNRNNKIKPDFRDDLNKKIMEFNRPKQDLVITDLLRAPAQSPVRDNDVVPSISQMCSESSSIRNRFSLGKKLGQGAFGEVRSVEGWAVKQILTKGGMSDRKMLAKEIFHLKKLKDKKNPNLPYLVDCFTEKGRGTNPIYIQQQKLYSNIDFDSSKTSSKGYMFLKKFSFEKRVQVWLEWLKSLQKIHNAGYVHLDIKPDNVMTTADFDVLNQDTFHLVFIDFGLMKKINDFYEIGHTLYFHPSVHGIRRNVAVIPSFDVYQACLTIFVVENYKYDSINRSKNRDSEDMLPVSRVQRQQFSEYFRGIKQNIWKNFNINDKRQNVTRVSDCKDFFCVVSFGIQGDVDKIPSLSSMIRKIEELYPSIKEEEEFDIETVVQKETKKERVRQQILNYAKQVKNAKSDNKPIVQQRKISNQAIAPRKISNQFNNNRVQQRAPISNNFQRNPNLIGGNRKVISNNINMKMGVPVKAINLRDDLEAFRRERIKNRINDIDKLAVPSQSNEQQRKPSNQFKRPPSGLNQIGARKQVIPSNQKKISNNFKVFI